MFLKRIPLMIAALLAITPALGGAPAEDPIIFFDGSKHGWRVDSSFVAYNSKGNVIFAGYRNNKLKYSYNIDENKSDNIDEINYKNYLDSYHFGIDQRLISRIVLKKIDEDRSDDVLKDGFDLFNNSWYVFLSKDNYKKNPWPRSFLYYDDKSNFYDNYDLNISKKGDLYLVSSKDAILYVIPKNMQDKVIIRDGLFYVSNRYWRVLHEKENFGGGKNKKIIYKGDYDEK